MKVQLERRMSSCPNHLQCTVCGQKFETPKIRALLYNNQELIQGDVCSDCLQLKTDEIKQKLRERAHLLRQIEQTTIQQQAIELFAAAEEELKLPTFYERWLKRLEIFSEETQELEAARFGACACRKRSRLRIVFENDQASKD
jgi:hypothetical protein